MNVEIPIYSVDGKLTFWAPPEWVERNRGNLRVIRSRRGHPRRAYLRDDDSELITFLIETRKRSSYGCAFMQALSCGRVWALKGVRGERAGMMLAVFFFA